MTLLISNDDVAQILTVADCTDALEATYLAAARGAAAAEPRSVIWSPRGPGRRHALATLQGAGLAERVAAIRIRSDLYSIAASASGTRDRKSAGGPGMFCGLLLLFSIDSGELLAIANDGLMQQLRVAATAVLASRHLARADSSRLAVIGAGNQARWHAIALAEEHPVREIRVFSPHPARRAAFATELEQRLGVRAVAVSSASQAIADADIVATCTNAREPVLHAREIAAGAFVTSVRHRAEMDRTILDLADVVVVNDTEGGHQTALGSPAEQEEAGIAPAPPSVAGYPSLVDLLSGRAEGRDHDSDLCYFMNNQGSGLQFVAVGALALEAAKSRGLGRELPTEWFLQDASS